MANISNDPNFMALRKPQYIGTSDYKIKLLNREDIKPYFGMTYIVLNIIKMDKDLPWRVYRSVLAHEEYHLYDKKFDSYFKREIRAWKFQWKTSKIDTILVVLYSLTKWYRIKLYWNLLLKKSV